MKENTACAIVGVSTLLISFLYVFFILKKRGEYVYCSSGQNLNCLQFTCAEKGPKCGYFAMRQDETGTYCSNAPRSNVDED